MTDQTNDDASKIIVDDDWKSQAQAEKDQLAAEEAAQAEQTPEGPEGQPQLPEASMLTLINSLAMQSMYALGGMEDPQTKKRIVDLGMAKFNIDLLMVLKGKTEGNLNEEETQLMEQALSELQMAFVQISKHVAEQGMPGAEGPDGGDAAPKIEV